MGVAPPERDAPRLSWGGAGFSRGRRMLAEEVPVALTYNGSTYAVMMATPSDLADFAIGFSLSEGIAGRAADIESIDIVELEDGVEARMWLKPAAAKRHVQRRRAVLGPTGCGLCGVDSIAVAIKPTLRVNSRFTMRPFEVVQAMARMQGMQRLNARTHAIHAAGLFHGRGELIVREDVGRHNALDKLLGAAASAGVPAAESAVLLTSRVSVELVQKTATLGAPIIAAVSAPTALAVRVAEAANITLAAVLRSDGFEIFTCPERIREEAPAHVA